MRRFVSTLFLAMLKLYLTRNHQSGQLFFSHHPKVTACRPWTPQHQQRFTLREAQRIRPHCWTPQSLALCINFYVLPHGLCALSPTLDARRRKQESFLLKKYWQPKDTGSTKFKRNHFPMKEVGCERVNICLLRTSHR